MQSKKIATFQTVTWRWMLGELVDEEEQNYEICVRDGAVVVRTPHAWVSLRQFLLSDIGRRVRHLYRVLGHHRLEALDGAVLDLYPAGAERHSIVVEGGELNGRAF